MVTHFPEVKQVLHGFAHHPGYLPGSAAPQSNVVYLRYATPRSTARQPRSGVRRFEYHSTQEGARPRHTAGVVLVLLGGLFLPHRVPPCHPRVAPLADHRQAPPMAARGRGACLQSPFGLLPTRPPATSSVVRSPRNPDSFQLRTIPRRQPPTLRRQLFAGFDRH